MGNYEQLKQSVSDVIKTNGNQEITGSILQNVLLTIISTVGANATFAGVATPTTNPGTPDGPVFYLSSESGTYTNFGSIELQDGLSVLMWNGSWSSQQIFGVDDVPTAGSDNLVKSGGVAEELALGAVYDVSAKNPTGGSNNDGKWESLSALLSDANLNTLIPTPVRKGGMSIKFVQSSDNKYVQYRCMAQNFTTDATQWQGVDDEPTLGSKNLVTSGGVENVTSIFVKHFDNNLANKYVREIYIKNTVSSPNINIYLGYNDLYGIRLYDGDTILGSYYSSDYRNRLLLIQMDTYGYAIIDMRNVTESDTIGRVNVQRYALDNNLLIKTYLEVGEEYNFQTVEDIRGYLSENVDVVNDFLNVLSEIKVDVEENNIYSTQESIVKFEDATNIGLQQLDGTIDTTQTGYRYSDFVEITQNMRSIKATSVMVSQWFGGLLLFASDQTTVVTQVLPGETKTFADYPTAKYFRYSGHNIGDIYVEVAELTQTTVKQKISEIDDTYDEVIIDVYDSSGVSAIQQAINSITDASKSKRYVIKLHGSFIADSDEDFNSFESVMNEKSIFAVKSSQSYITIQGDGIDKTLVKGALPNNLGTSYPYDLRTVATINGNNIVVKDLTLAHDNGRYIVHTYGAPSNAVQKFENVRFICPNNTGDALTVWSSKCPYGAGFQDGNDVEIKNCVVESEKGLFLCHDNTGMTIPFKLKMENIKYIKTGNTQTIGNISFIGSVCKSEVCLNNIIGGYGGINLAYGNSDFVDDGCIDIKANIGERAYISPLRQSIVQSQLKVSVNDNLSQHSIKFDTSSSAFNAILKDDMPCVVGNYGIKLGDGFIYKEGGIGFSAWCMGMKPVYNSNGLRALGDCSVTNKVLGFVIDNTSYSITLDQNYSNMSNTDILADINNKLSDLAIPCTASFYSYGMEFCFGNTTDIVEMVNNGEDDITAGHIVKRLSNGFTLCTKTADMLGFLLDDTKVGEVGRIMIRGFLGRYTPRYFALPRGFHQDGDRFGCSSQGVMTAEEDGPILGVAEGGQFIIFPA